MTDSAMKIYSAGGVDWRLTEEGLRGVVEQFSHPGNKRRHYMVLDYQGGRVFIKSFHEKGFSGRLRHLVSPRGRIEFQTGSRLAALGIPTPKALGYGIGENISATVTEYIDAQSLLDMIKKTTSRDALYGLLAGLLEQLRIKHVRHNDLHLDNILVQDNRGYLIDLHKTKIKRSFNDADEISNAAHALGMIYDEISNKERDFFFQQYGCTEKIKKGIEKEIGRFKRNWVVNKKKRAFKNTSVLSVTDGYIYVRGAENEANGEFVAFIKKDKKVTVELYSDHIRKIYRHQRRLRTAWENHVVFTYLGSNAVPRSYYVKLPILSSDGYIAMEDMGHKGIELDRFLDGKYDTMTSVERGTFVDSFAVFLLSLFRQRIGHRDMKACNIFVLYDRHFVFLDIEDIVFEEIKEGMLKKMLVQLNTTLPKRISVMDRMRFFCKITLPLSVDRKRLLKDVVRESLESDIVYEGVGGLVRESW